MSIAAGIHRGRVVLVLLLAAATRLAAQTPTPAPSSRERATVVVDASMYWLRDTSRTPIRQLAAGTTVTVLRRVGGWYQIVYTDPEFGDETGYVLVSALRFDGGTGTGGKARSSVLSQRGFVDLRGVGLSLRTPNEPSRGIGDVLVRDDLFYKPSHWLQFAAGVDVRVNSHDQVEDDWSVNFDDRGLLRPRISVRRLAAAITTPHVTIDAGKQFIRWGRADILNPTDRFAPKDFLNPLDNQVLPVLGVRTSLRLGTEMVEGVWLPQMSPSRLPLLQQRWTIVPPGERALAIDDRGAVFPDKMQTGVRWLHSGRFDLGLSVFDGSNHIPNIDVQVDDPAGSISFQRSYTALRTFGGEVSIPTSVVTVKAESALFTSPDHLNEEYVLYVLEAERQVGEWLLDGGYVGEVVTSSRPGIPFGAERGIAKSIIGRASYAVDPRRDVSVETAVRQNRAGFYVKGEYSQAVGAHLRITFSAVGIGGKASDFLGQYARNSHGSAALRVSF